MLMDAFVAVHVFFCLPFVRVETWPETERGKDEGNLFACGSARSSSGAIQKPDHCWKCGSERPDGGQGRYR